MKIAAVNDNQKNREVIIDNLIKFQNQKRLQFEILEYDNGEDLLDDFKNTEIQIIFFRYLYVYF